AAILEIRVEKDSRLTVAMDRAQRRDLHALYLERFARRGNLDPLGWNSEASGIFDAVGWHHEDALTLLGKKARRLPVEMVAVLVCDERDIEHWRQLGSRDGRLVQSPLIFGGQVGSDQQTVGLDEPAVVPGPPQGEARFVGLDLIKDS